MNEDRDHALAECLEDYHRRRALDEAPREGDYRERLGERYSDFLLLLQAESAIDAAIAPPLPTQLPVAFGEYTLLRSVGRGAVGVVYEALHRRLGRKVALKVLRTGFDTEPKALERFKREARSCAQVRHDNLVTIFEAGDVEGQPYYAMELLPGSPLSVLIRAGRCPKGRALYEGLAGIAAGLQALHDAGIVHRDVKPSNIVVEPGGRMVLTDFGLARTAFASDLTTTGEAIGTPLYMSPEQMLGRRDEIDGRSDVYGVGATLYEALAARPPFKTDDLHELIRMAQTERPAPLRSVAPGVPADVEHVVMKAVERRKEDRYDSAKALRDDLLRLAAGEPVHGRPVSSVVRILRRTARQRLAIAAVLLLAAAGVATWVLTRPALLSVRSQPEGMVFAVNGTVVGPSPWERSFDPGTVQVTWEPRTPKERDEWFPHTETAELRRGSSTPLPVLLTPTLRNTDTAAAGEERTRPRTTRVVPVETEPRAFLPRGNVRLRDLTDLLLVLPASYENDGTLEIRRGDEVLHREANVEAPVSLKEYGVRAVPDSVRAALKVGDRVTWRCVPPKGLTKTESIAEFTVVADDPALDARLDRIARDHAQNPVFAGSVRAQALLRAGLAVAAFREAQAVAAPPDTLGPLLPVYVQYDALRSLGLESEVEALDLAIRLEKDPRKYAEFFGRPPVPPR